MIMLNLWVWWQTDKQKQAQQLNATLFVYWSIPTSLLHLGMTRAVFLFCILYRASMLCMKLKSVIFHFRTKLSKWLSFAFKNCHLKSKVVHQVHTICKKKEANLTDLLFVFLFIEKSTTNTKFIAGQSATRSSHDGFKSSTVALQRTKV